MSFWSVLLRLLGYMKPYWQRTAVAYLGLLTVTALGLIVPWLLKEALDNALAQPNATVVLTRLAAGLFALGAIKGLFSFAQRYLSAWLSHRIAYDLRNELYGHIQSLSFAFHDHAHTGQLMSRCTSDVSSVESFAGTGLMEFANIVVLSGSILAILFSTHGGLALASLAPIPVILLIAVRLGRRMHPLFKRIQQQRAEMITILQENFAGVQVVKAFGREPYEAARFRDANVELMERRLDSVREWSFNFPMMTFIISMGTAVILWYGGNLVVRDVLSVGTLVAFNLYLGMLAMPIQRLGWLVNMAAEAVASGERIFEVLDTPSPVQEKPDAIGLPAGDGRVEFRNVSAGYGNETVLQDVSFIAEPGRTVALLGATGSGKSTVIHLLPRFYDVTSGQILIDGVDIRDLRLDSLRRQIGIVLQDTVLFSDTIRENICYGRTEVTEEEIVAAAKTAHAHEFIMEFPHGYDTLIGERGITLSGGQRQRVAIARALLMDPRILLLDDSTSSVDMETEYLIQQALARLMVGRTTFVIAQRLSTVIRAHEILVLDKGRIVERGSHATLLAQGGLYAQVYDLQLRRQEASPPSLQSGLSDLRTADA